MEKIDDFRTLNDQTHKRSRTQHNPQTLKNTRQIAILPEQQNPIIPNLTLFFFFDYVANFKRQNLKLKTKDSNQEWRTKIEIDSRI